MAADHVMMSQSPEWSNAYFRSLTCPTHRVSLGFYLLEKRFKPSGLSARLFLRDAEILPLETHYACMADPANPHDVYVRTDRNGVYASLGPTGTPTDAFPLINDFTAGFIPEIDPQGRIRAYPSGLQARQAPAPQPAPTPQPAQAPVVAPTIDAQALAQALGPVLAQHAQTRTRTTVAAGDGDFDSLAGLLEGLIRDDDDEAKLVYKTGIIDTGVRSLEYTSKPRTPGAQPGNVPKGP